MDLVRWACGAAVLLSAGTLANCSQIFEGSDAQVGGPTNAPPVGQGAGSVAGISHGRTYSEQRLLAAGPALADLPLGPARRWLKAVS